MRAPDSTTPQVTVIRLLKLLTAQLGRRLPRNWLGVYREGLIGALAVPGWHGRSRGDNRLLDANLTHNFLQLVGSPSPCERNRDISHQLTPDVGRPEEVRVHVDDQLACHSSVITHHNSI